MVIQTQSDLIAQEITIDPIVDKFSGIGNKISQWKFFTDDNHMENGFWDQHQEIYRLASSRKKD